MVYCVSMTIAKYSVIVVLCMGLANVMTPRQPTASWAGGWAPVFCL